MFSTKVEKCSDVAAPGYDAVVVVAPTVSLAPEAVSSIQYNYMYDLAHTLNQRIF